jgi:lysophospholipid acyltransferase (LPLAT)-like uncharacterized protein
VRWISSKRILAAPWLQKAAGITGAEYLRLVQKTTRFTVEPHDLYQQLDGRLPVIVAMWHGQHIMMPYLRRDEHRVKVLISRHRDGEINAITAERLGIGTIRGSGSHRNDFHRKGAVSAFMTMVEALRDGYNVALTADVPKVSRVAGRGIILLSQTSGRPIYPVAITTSRRIQLNNWDRSTIGLPFGRGAVVVGPPVSAAADADDATVEAARAQLQAGLDAVTTRAYAIVDRNSGEAARV